MQMHHWSIIKFNVVEALFALWSAVYRKRVYCKVLELSKNNFRNRKPFVLIKQCLAHPGLAHGEQNFCIEPFPRLGSVAQDHRSQMGNLRLQCLCLVRCFKKTYTGTAHSPCQIRNSFQATDSPNGAIGTWPVRTKHVTWGTQPGVKCGVPILK